MAAGSDRGRIGKSRSAASLVTTVGFLRPSINFRPTFEYRGVTSFSHRLDSRGVSTGTGIMSRVSPRCRAYSRMIAPYDTLSGPPISKIRGPPAGRSIAATR
ncbi:MAG: hypothetical protein EBX36_00190 [Planctomycetia bacterium]|nr:hypothetical protein [Planctomycetia bacterium]